LAEASGEVGWGAGEPGAADPSRRRATGHRAELGIEVSEARRLMAGMRGVCSHMADLLHFVKSDSLGWRRGGEAVQPIVCGHTAFIQPRVRRWYARGRRRSGRHTVWVGPPHRQAPMGRAHAGFFWRGRCHYMPGQSRAGAKRKNRHGPNTVTTKAAQFLPHQVLCPRNSVVPGNANRVMARP
jgi:hypothetical protein